ncbi:EcsC family protein [Paracoccus sp. p4-l81]|uniref:EcsC family protein n=1 Tax=unclassified Paracoccus (in: a-proteobacteria) TaxID=2688777 RepID=UPI0035B8C98B
MPHQPAPPQIVLPPITDPTVHATLDRLAHRYVRAGGLGMDILAYVGGSAETLLARLPGPVRDRLDDTVRAALHGALAAAGTVAPPRGGFADGVNRAVVSAIGAAGGAVGIAGAMAELPVTITVLLRTILGIAAEHGLDPADPATRAEALRVFASAGPMADDDGTDLGLLAARLTVTGHSLQALIARIAPRLAAVIGQKLAAQSAPVLGAVAGASINYSFTRYYQQMARVHFGLLRLADETGLPREVLIEALQSRIRALEARKRARRA